VRVELLAPDAPARPPEVSGSSGDTTNFARALDALGSLLGGADDAENAFGAGTGSLQNAVYERARADVALAVATAEAQRTAQAVTSILNMQV
jgi:hypothetical protein